MSRFLCSIFLVITLTTVPAGAAERHDTLDNDPRVGEKIPHSLAVRDQHNQHQDFKSLARRRGLILMFSRSLDW